MKRRTDETIWNRFNELAAATDKDREQVYRDEGAQFLSNFVKHFTVNYDVPDIHSAREFSECIIFLRQDYRECNQYLMDIMIGFDASEGAKQQFENFIANCIWMDLVSAARNFSV